MNIVKIDFKKKGSIETIISQIKDIDTKIKQLKHAKEGLIRQVEPLLNNKYEIFGAFDQLVATCMPCFRNSLNQKLLKSEFPDVAEACMENKIVKGRWVWL